MRSHPFDLKSSNRIQRVDQARFLSSLLTLLKIDGPSGKEETVRTCLYKDMQRLGADSLRIDSKGNLHAALRGGHPGGGSLLLTAHMDTFPSFSGERTVSVSPEGTITETGNLNLGVDDRGGIAMILEVICASSLFLHHLERLHVLFTVKEETGWQGARAISQRYLSLFDAIISVDVPVRTSPVYEPHIAVCHCDQNDPLQALAEETARTCGLSPTVLNYRSGYIGGDASVFFERGAKVIDFCSGAVYQHSSSEWCSLYEMIENTEWLLEFCISLSKMQKSFFSHFHPRKGTMPSQPGTIHQNLFTEASLCARKRDSAAMVSFFENKIRLLKNKGMAAIPPGLADLTALCDLFYDDAVSGAFYRFIFACYRAVRTSCEKKSFAWFFLCRLRARHPGMCDLEKIFLSLFQNEHSLVTGAPAFTSWQRATVHLLGDEGADHFALNFPPSHFDFTRTWNSTRNLIIRLIRHYRLTLGREETTALFISGLKDAAIRRETLSLISDPTLPGYTPLDFTAIDPGSDRGRFFLNYFTWIYPRVSEDIKASIIGWLGELGGREAALFLFNRFRENEKLHHALLPGLKRGAQLIIPEILAWYREKPFRAMPLLEMIPFNFKTFIEKNRVVFGDVEDTAIMETARRYRDIWYFQERGRDTEAFLFLSLRLVMIHSQRHDFSEVTKFITLVSTLENPHRKRGFLKIFNRVNPLKKNYILEFILKADNVELNIFIRHLEDDQPPGNLRQLIASFQKKTSFSVTAKEGRQQLFTLLGNEFQRLEFDRFCDSVSGISLPEAACHLPPFIINSEGSNAGTETGFRKKIHELRPEKSATYEKTFAPFLENAVAGKKARKKMFQALRGDPLPVESIDELKSFIKTASPEMFREKICALSPLVLQCWYNEKNNNVEEAAFRFFLEALYRDPSFNELRKDETLLEEDYLPLIQHALLDTENMIYGPLAKEIIASCEKEFDAAFPGRENIFSSLSTISELRHFLRLRKSQLTGNSREKSPGKELSFIDRQQKRLFLVEKYNSRLTGVSGEKITGGDVISFRPGKDHALAFRSDVAGDCNLRNIDQLKDPASLFYYIFYRSRWCGYASLVILEDKTTGKKALVIDVINMRNVPKSADIYIPRFIENLIDFCRAEDFNYLLSGQNIEMFSNYDYIRSAARPYYRGNPVYLPMNAVIGAAYQSINMDFTTRHYYNLIWSDKKDLTSKPVKPASKKEKEKKI